MPTNDQAPPTDSSNPAPPPALPERVSHFDGAIYCPPHDAPAPPEYEAHVTAAGNRGPNWGLLGHVPMLLGAEDLRLQGDASTAPGPDWEQIYHNLDGEPLQSENEPPRHSDDMGKALAAIIGWVLASDWQNHSAFKTIAMRTVAMAWVVNPDRFGEDASLATLAKALGYKSPTFMSELTADFSRRFGIRNRYQRAHNWRTKGEK